MGPEVSVVIPTYNEAANVPVLLAGLAEALEGVAYEAIVVDDNSPDGTAEAARSAGARAIVRTAERGLATAVMEGIRQANGEHVVVMDADLQHPPAMVLRLLEQARDGADMVIGSRYVDGGSDGSFSPVRRLMSRGARFIGKMALPPLRRFHLTDPMSGLFLVRRASVDVDALRPVGYKILLEIIGRNRFEDVREVGFEFGHRLEGESKLGASVMVQYLLHLMTLMVADADNRRVARFGLVGLSGVLVNLGMLWALVERGGMHYAGAAVIAIEASILSNFLLNDRFTFRDRRTGHRVQRLLKFNAVSLTALLLNLTVLVFLTEILRVNYLVSEAIAIIAAFAANYTGNVRWTYGGAGRFRLRTALRALPGTLLLAPLVLGVVATAFYAHDLDAIDEVYFDEHYYVSVARQMDNGIWEDACWEGTELDHRPLNYEHPPLAKLIMGWSVERFDTSHKVFEGCRDPSGASYEAFLHDLRTNGNPAAWRMPSAIFGGLTVAGIAWAATRILDHRGAGWLAGLLVLADTMILSSSRIALLDIFATGFAALALAAATYGSKRGIALAALLLGLGFASKFPVIFLGLPVLGVSLWSQHRAGALTRRRFDATLATMVLVPLAVWIITYWPWWRIWVPEMGVLGAASHLVELTKASIAWTAAGVQVHVDSSQPISWFRMDTPVMYYSRETDATVARVYAIGNPILWWGGGFAVVASVVHTIRARLGRTATKADAALLMAVLPALFAYGGFLLLSRTAFLFYMTLVAPFLALAGAALVHRVWFDLRGRALSLAWIGAVLIGFSWFAPLVLAQELSWDQFRATFDAFSWIDP